MISATKLKTLLVIVTGLAVLSIIFENTYLLYAAVSVGVLSLAIPITGGWIVYLWEKIGEIIGWFTSRLLLTLIFYVFLFPIAMMARLFAKNMMDLKPAKGKSMFTERNHKYVKEDLENIW